MPLVEAWYDPHKKKYFSRKADYRAHLRKVAAVRMASRRLERTRALEVLRIDALRIGARSTHEIEQWVHRNFQMMVERGRREGIVWGRDTEGPCKLKTLTITLRGPYEVRCSHSAPIGKHSVFSTNSNSKNLPTHYMGFTGRIEIEFEGKWFDSNLMKVIHLYTGTGGGGAGHRSYDLTAWADDFPQLLG